MSKTTRPNLEEAMRRAAGDPPAAPRRGDLPDIGERRFHAATREGKRRITVHLDPDMHRELRQLALDLDRSAEAIVVDWIAHGLAKERKRQ